MSSPILTVPPFVAGGRANTAWNALAEQRNFRENLRQMEDKVLDGNLRDHGLHHTLGRIQKTRLLLFIHPHLPHLFVPEQRFHPLLKTALGYVRRHYQHTLKIAEIPSNRFSCQHFEERMEPIQEALRPGALLTGLLVSPSLAEIRSTLSELVGDASILGPEDLGFENRFAFSRHLEATRKIVNKPAHLHTLLEASQELLAETAECEMLAAARSSLSAVVAEITAQYKKAAEEFDKPYRRPTELGDPRFLSSGRQAMRGRIGPRPFE